MRPTELLAKLYEAGCRVVVDGNTLRVRGLLDGKLRSEIREHKSEILRLLGSSGGGAVVSSCIGVAVDRTSESESEDINLLRTGAKQGQADMLERTEPNEPESQKEGPAITIEVRKVQMSAQDPSRCPVCGGDRWWRSIHGCRVCSVCHPPAAPGLVVRWEERDLELPCRQAQF